MPSLSGARSLVVPVCVILMLQTAASRVLSIPERELPLPDLHAIPPQLGQWKVQREAALDESTKEYLHPDEYILRDYVNDASGASVNLFVAYFKSLRNRYGPHSPRVCLPGSGWLVRSSTTAFVQVPGRAQRLPVNEYVLDKAGNRILVVYWYQNDRDVWTDEFWAKFRMLPDLIRYRRSDVSLVRLVSPAASLGTRYDFGDCLQFTKLVLPRLSEHFETIR